jgi:serine/threonine protein kinase
MNPNYSEFKFPHIKANQWEKIFSNNGRKVNKQAVDLISKILKYNPEQRPTPLKALTHPFFDDLRKQGVVLPNGQPLPDLFDFSEEERNSTSVETIKALIPQWYIDKNNGKGNE